MSILKKLIALILLLLSVVSSYKLAHANETSGFGNCLPLGGKPLNTMRSLAMSPFDTSTDTSQYLHGSTLIYGVFVQTADSSDWPQSKRGSLNIKVDISKQTLINIGLRANVNLSFRYEQHPETIVTIPTITGGSTSGSPDDAARQICQSKGVTNDNGGAWTDNLCKWALAEYSTNNAVVIFFYDRPDRAFAIPNIDNKGCYACIFFQDIYPYRELPANAISHEILHLFGARDEYPGNGNGHCGADITNPWVKKINPNAIYKDENQADCVVRPHQCIMGEESRTYDYACPSTLGSIGLGDINNNGIVDPEDVSSPQPLPSNAQFIADVTIPDGTQFAANQTFTKTWRIKNTGSSTWGNGYRWTFDGGDKLGGPDSIGVPAIGPGNTFDPSVGLRASGSPGTYRGYWRMQAPDGTKFGTRVWVEIKVGGSNGSAYVADVNVPDGTTFGADQDFTKVWRIKNTGTTSWGSGYRWTFDGGQKMNGPDYIDVPSINPGSTWDPSVGLRAPGNPGTYRGYWRMQAPDGTKFGTQVWVEINVTGGGGSSVTTFVSETATAAYDGASGFWRHGTSSYWHDASIGDGGHMLWTKNNDTAHGIDNMGDWRPNLPETRWYEVFVFIPRLNASTTQARYEIYHADGRTDVAINQSIYFDAWVSLGTYRFNSGTGGLLRLIDVTNESYISKQIGFDSAKWEGRDGPVTAPPGATLVVSESDGAAYDGASGFWRHGTSSYWHDASIGDGGHMLWTKNNDTAHGIDNMGDWRPNITRAGKYEVFVFIPRLNASTTQARYEIYHADGRTDVAINQSIYFDAWVSLGTYRFNSGTGGLLRLIDVTNESYISKQIGFDSAKWEARPELAVPNPPNNLQPRDGASVSQDLTFSWNDAGMDDGNASVDFKVEVWRVTNGQRAEQIWDSGYKSGTTRAWTAPGPGEYEWLVHAGNGINRDVQSAPARFQVPVPLPDAPSHLALTPASAIRVDLSWRDNSSNEEGFKIERITSDVSTEIGIVGSDVTTLTDTGLLPNTTYRYRVRAFNSAGHSDYCAEVTTTTLATYPTSIVLSPDVVTGGQSSTVTVNIGGSAPAGGLRIAVSSSAPDIAPVPANIDVLEGLSFATFTIPTKPGTSDVGVTISASLNEVTTSAGLTIIPTKPANVSVTPSAFISPPGTPRAISALYLHPGGVSRIKDAYILVQNKTSTAGSLYGYYDATNNLLYLYGDNGTTRLGGFAPGSNNVISNTQGSLNCKATTVVRSGNILTVNWNFTPGASYSGLKNIYLYSRDISNNTDGWDDLGDWFIKGSSNLAPVDLSVTPGSLTSSTGVAKTFSTVYTDGDSVLDLKEAYIMVQTSVSGAKSLYGYYDVVNDKLYLYSDNSAVRQGGFAPSSDNVISNSQGSLNCKTTTVVRSGNTLTVNWNFTPSASFAGLKNVYLYCRDTSNTVDGWDDLGDWLIKGSVNIVPVNLSITPNVTASNFGIAKTFTAVYSDGDSVLDLKEAYIMVQTSVNGAKSLYGYYDAVNNLLYLYSDNSSTRQGGFAPGSDNVISNSQGNLNCKTTTVVRNGNTLTVNWNFTPSASFSGLKNIYLYSRDNSNVADGWDDLGDWFIKGSSNVLPVNTSVTPSTTVSIFGTARTLSAVYTDADGALDIKEAYVIVRNVAGSASGLYGYYDVANNLLYLYDDNGTTRLGGFAPGSNNVISNSQGSLNCKATTVVRSGNTLTVNWNFTPSASYSGLKNVYLYSRDISNATDGWDDLGDWLIKGSSNLAPVDLSVAPGSLTSGIGVAKTLSAVYSDGDTAADIKDAYIVVNNKLAVPNSLYAYYDVVNNLLYLCSDNGTTRLGGFAPGSNNVISNSQGSLNCKTTTVVRSGNTLTVNWNFTPNSSFTGLKNVYLFCRDTSNVTDGYDDLGDWIITGSAARTSISGS